MKKWKPGRSDYVDALNGQNPWHQLRRVPAEMARPVYRPLAEVLWYSVLHPQFRRHQIILGPRRVGKTTVMYQTVQQLMSAGVVPQDLWWLRLDHPLLLDLSLGDMVKQIITVRKATNEKPVFLFLDELTYAAKWDLWLKTFYDEQWPVRLVGTSSATAAIRDQATESGVGRWDEQFLAPYLFTEYLDLNDQPTFLPVQSSLSDTLETAIDEAERMLDFSDHRKRYTLVGGFPELLMRDKSNDQHSDLLRSQRILRQDAVEKAIYKDIPQAFSIQDPIKLERLLYILGGQMTDLFSPATIGNDVQLTAPTLEKYVRFLEQAFLVFTLPNYSPNEETVQRRGRKVYFVDGAVRNAALQRGIAPLNDATEMGCLVENLAAAHLNALAQQNGIRLYHWRHRKEEVDLIYDEPDNPLAFEIAMSPQHHCSGLRTFQERFPRFRGNCYLISPGAVPTRPNIDDPGRLPLDVFLIAVGKQAEAALERRLGSKQTIGRQMLLPLRP